MWQYNGSKGRLLAFVLGLSCLGLGCQQDASTEGSSAQEGASTKKSTPGKDSSASAKTSSQDDAKAVAKPSIAARKKLKRDENVKQATHVEPVIDAPIAWHDDTPAAMPHVVMSDGHAATCLVKVGQTLPDVTLADVNGQQKELSKLMGDHLTVVVLWSNSNIHAATELSDLAAEVASPMAARGVHVVGICEQDAPSAAKETAAKAGVSYPILVDSDGKYFSQLATDKLPRTYLLDGAGKVLWLDIEYSRITHHDLMQAIRFALGER